MAPLTLVIGNKNYSSWSMRAGVALRQFNIAVEEIVIPLDQPDSTARIREHSSAGRVPVLHDGDLTVWESLAICEYASESHTDPPMWPAEPVARAHARAVAHEMHAGFEALRSALPMDCRAHHADWRWSESAQADIDRIVGLWTQCRAQFGQSADEGFLFGGFSIADAMYAPIASRFSTYNVPLPETAAEYRDAILGAAAVQHWIAAASAEPWVIETSQL